MSEKHNPTPWTSSGAYIDDSNGLAVADTLSTATGNATRYANAARIVACVNACEGVDTEDLTIGCYQKLLDKHVEVCFAKQDAEAKRDELLAALKGVLNVVNVRIDDPRINQFDARLQCQKCGHETGWNTFTNATEAKSQPCPRCNK